MNKTQQVTAYFCQNYPHKGELSKARLTKLVYLADWFSALVNKKQITDISWLFNHYGPYVEDVVNSARQHPDFNITSDRNFFGGHKELISFHGEVECGALTDRERSILNAIIEKTQNMYFNDFISYVYSTYPVTSRNRYSELNLVKLAQELREKEMNTTS